MPVNIRDGAISPNVADTTYLIGQGADLAPRRFPPTLLLPTAASRTPVANQKSDASNATRTLTIGATDTLNALMVGQQFDVTATSTNGKLTGVGHVIGDQVTLTMNLGAVTHTLMIGSETSFTTRGASGGVTLMYGNVVHPINGMQGTISLMCGYHVELANGDIDPAATVVAMVDYNSPDVSAVTKLPLVRYSLRNVDPGKIIETKGQLLLASGQEAAPANHLGVVSGRYYFGMNPTALTPVALSANFIYFVPTHIPERTTITRIGARVTTLSAGNIQFAIYRSVDGLPDGAPVVSTGSISTGTTGDKEATISTTLEAGEYLFALNCSATPQVNWMTDAGLNYAVGTTTSNGLESTPLAAQTFGTWPTSPSVGYTAVANAVPQIWWRVV